MMYTVNDILKLMEKGFTHEQIVAMCQANNGTATTAKPAKGTGKGKARKGTGAKAPSGEFDRAKYVECAKRLGCYNAEFDKVVATVENGKVIRTAKKNRELVYAEMAKGEAPKTEEPKSIHDMTDEEFKNTIADLAKAMGFYK